MRPWVSLPTRVTPVVDVETVTLARADGRILAHDILAPLPLPPFTNSAVDGYAVSSRDLPQQEEQAFPVIGRVQAGGSATCAAQAGAGDAHLHRRADARRRRYRVHAGRRPRRWRQGRSSRGPQARRQCASRGRRHSRRLCGAEGRPAAAAAGCRACRGLRPDAARCRQAHSRRGVLDRQRTGLAGRSARRGAIVRFQPLHADGDAGAARLRGQRSRHPQGRSRRARARAAGGGRHATI